MTFSKLIPRIADKIGCTFLLVAVTISVVARKPAHHTTTILEELMNLLDKQNPEFSGSGVLTSEAKRTAYGKLVWRF